VAPQYLNELRIGAAQYEELRAHLLRPDRDEHGALLLVGAHISSNRRLLTVREVHPLDDEEFPPGAHGYRQFAAPALARLGTRAADERLALVTAHSHPSSRGRNALSRDDLTAHERVFPHLLDITCAPVVAGVALGESSVAGEIWSRAGERQPLNQLRVVGHTVDYVFPEPPRSVRETDDRFDRQVRLFGPVGQARLRALHVAVVGAGGGGSILIEHLAHLGVGRITAVDFDVVKRHNLSRIMGATEVDARLGVKKVEIARRLTNAIDLGIDFRPIDGDIADDATAQLLIEADYILLATDTATARLVANAVSQAFLIPLIQIGAKVETRRDGKVEQIYTAVRPVLPRRGCLSCAGVIDPMALQREAATLEERSNQNYLGDADVIDPSVTTLNAAAAAGALNVLLMSVIGQASDELAAHRITLTRQGHVLALRDKRDRACRWCGEQSSSRYARADLSLLPVRAGMRAADPAAPPRPRRRAILRRLLGRR
jgi:molybdopterin/thiamine biosynthesis adenylyltransferase